MRSSRVKQWWVVVCVVALASLLGGGQAMGAKPYQRAEMDYTMPDVTLIDQDNEEVSLRELIYGDKPVFVDFIYATCTTICPVLSAGFANLQKKLGDDAEQVHLISFSIDPDYDTPEVMAQYLKRYRARPGWSYLSGSREDMEAVMRAFDAYVSDKMEHRPLTFLKGPGQSNWVRINGLLGTADLLNEFNSFVDM